MDRRKLYVSIVAGAFAFALPVAAALAMSDGNGGSAGGNGGSGGSDGSNASKNLAITSDSAANSDYQDAQSAMDRADYKAAADLLEKVLSRQPDNADALNLMGFSERKLGETSIALAHYKKALDLQPDHIGANGHLGELYLELKQLDMAEQRLAVLHQVCGNCEAYSELKAKIEEFRANPS